MENKDQETPLAIEYRPVQRRPPVPARTVVLIVALALVILMALLPLTVLLLVRDVRL